MGEFRPDYLRIIRQSDSLSGKEEKAFELKKHRAAVNENVPQEIKEIGQELQARVQILIELYRTNYGFNKKNLISDNSVESLTACLEPNRAEYVLGHFKELDALAARAEYEPRLLPKAQAAIEVWEKLDGALPTDLVEDGLEVDAHAFTNLRRFIDSLKNPIISSNKKRTEEILKKLRSNNPELVDMVENTKPPKGE